MKRSPIVFAVALAVLTVGCSKSNLPSGPGSAPGTPVLVRGTPIPNASRQYTVNPGSVKNQSGLTIYQVKIGVEVYRNAPFDESIDTVFDVGIDSLHHGDSTSFIVPYFFADKFLNMYPVYSYLPPSP